ncbi:MAG: helix-turn-helix transcriptional regulator [Pseudomonadota bacterium]
MGARTEQHLSEDANQRAALRVREELARRRITRQKLAADAMISLSTLEKALSGKRPFTMATLIRLEEALTVPLRDTPPPAPNLNGAHAATNGLAPETLGSYARPAVSWIEGDYLTLRPSFGDNDSVYAYRTSITWDDELSRLVFREADRMDDAFTQWGNVSIPHQSGHTYLVTNRHGQHRMIVLSRPTICGEMHGILTTLQAGPGAHLTPVATPIVFLPRRDEIEFTFGRIPPGHACFETYSAALHRTVNEPYARFPKP